MPAPPTEVESHNHLPHGFVLNDKLLLPSWTPGVAFVYYPKPKKWIKLERALSLPSYYVFLGVSSLGDVDVRSVVLTWNLEGLSGPGAKYDIHALLVDNQDYCILRDQRLDELNEAIQPSYFDDCCSALNMVDLGNSKVCVIIGGAAEDIPSVCILVVELGLVQEEEQQRFLSVRVLVNRVFDMRPYLSKYGGLQGVCTSFLFSLSKGTSDIDWDAVKDHICEKVPTLTSASLEVFSGKRSSGKDDPSTEGDKDNVVKVAQSKEISLNRRKLESDVVGLDKYLEVSQLKDKARELGMKDMTEALKAKEKESEEMVKQITTLQSQLKGRDEKIEALNLKVGEMFRKGFDRAISQIKALAPEVNVVDMDVSKIVVNGVLVDADIQEEGCDVKENE